MNRKLPARIYRRGSWQKIWILSEQDGRCFVKWQDGHVTAWVPREEVKRVIRVPRRKRHVHRRR